MIYNINIDIPGWTGRRDLVLLAKLASMCPENTSILEVGVFLGRSTHALYHNKPKSVLLSVIDKFTMEEPYSSFDDTERSKVVGNVDMIKNAAVASRNENSLRAGFEYCIGSAVYNKIDVNVCTSADYNKTSDFELVYIDGSHAGEDVKQDIDKFITDTNLIVGDDFGLPFDKYKGLMMAVSYCAAKYKRKLIVPEDSRQWILVPNKGYWYDKFGGDTIGNLGK
jgi:hypothetical protein